ncbi:MAG TPA: hypothetical protein VMS17_30870 [Gemmataceae bacterium]|nr:hypothetical protein [Gemmataceae bacterium]
MAMDVRTQTVLQQAFQRESLSMLRYVGEAYPWADAAGGATLQRLREIEAEDGAETASLGRFLFRRHVSPSFSSTFPVGFTTINFLALGHLLPRLVADQRRAVADLERDAASVTDADAKAELEKLVAVKRLHLSELEGLKVSRGEPMKV